MCSLKIKVSLGSFNVELEGPSADVISQFDEIKKNGLGQMIDQLVPIFTQNKKFQEGQIPEDVPEEHAQAQLSAPIAPTDGISLQNVVIKQLPKSEPEWVLIYCYFIVQAGKGAFTRTDIITKYGESNRKSEVRMKNLSASVKGAVRKNWISALNDKDYIITDGGRTHAKQILARTGGTSKPPRERQKKDNKDESPPATTE
jgi:hypothetical protein